MHHLQVTAMPPPIFSIFAPFRATARLPTQCNFEPLSSLLAIKYYFISRQHPNSNYIMDSPMCAIPLSSFITNHTVQQPSFIFSSFHPIFPTRILLGAGQSVNECFCWLHFTWSHHCLIFLTFLEWNLRVTARRTDSSQIFYLGAAHC